MAVLRRRFQPHAQFQANFGLNNKSCSNYRQLLAGLAAEAICKINFIDKLFPFAFSTRAAMTALNPSHLAPAFQPDLRFERLLDGFSPSFEFEPAGPLPESEFVDRLRRIRREAVVSGHDVILIHADSIGSYKVSNSYLRYVCDWAREGVLVIPTDDDKPLTLFSIFSSSVLLPPAGEPVLVEDI
jgi:hypothetical protein